MLISKNPNIIFNKQDIQSHSKAAESYVDVTLKLNLYTWSGWIPIEYRRTGLDLKTEKEIINYIEHIYQIMNTTSIDEWKEKEEYFWANEKPRASVTKSFFDALSDGQWKCRNHELPQNPNFARRIQDLKELGYTIATNTHKYCSYCEKNTTHLLMVPIPRVIIAGNGYETWSAHLRKRIINILKSYDAYEGKNGQHLLPDHKFSEIRWDENTKSLNPDNMTDEEILNKFQLLTNQRNQQKREACRNCYNTNKRGYPFGIPFFYNGDENWDNTIPKKGKEAERGCIGCGWYDLEKWRKELIKNIRQK